jgi:hypothetical protein
MKIKVTKKGVLIPLEFLEGVKEVEIRKENGLILVLPTIIADPILGLGKHPVVCGLPDASENHDKYLYDE